jgi:3-deoxy-7-phosphoheptulonate synthase
MYTLASRTLKERSTVSVDGVRFGGGSFVTIAGPCAVESPGQIEATARFVRECGAAMLRGGAYKPRTSPYAFQGLGDDGVRMIAAASSKAGIPSVVEAVSESQLPLLARSVSMVQIGARNMQNFSLLRAAAATGKPVLLKRGASATLDEVLYAAEYLLVEGNSNVILCERGVRTFDSHTRNLFDLAGALALKRLTHLPVIADPSHATGRPDLIEPLVLASAAAGLDGAIVEVHPNPAVALSDKEQALDFPAFARLMDRLRLLTGQSSPSKVQLAACR